MFFENKKVLVTGGAGVIGRELIRLLADQKAHVRCIDFLEKPEMLNALNVEYYRLDLSDDRNQFLFAPSGGFMPEYVFHLAADFERSEETETFWEFNFRNNVMASHNTLRSAMESPALKKIVFASSYLIYNKDLYYSEGVEANCLSEHTEIDPRNMCGIAKLQTERDLEFLGSLNDFKHASARIFRVYGQGSRDVISRWIRSAIRNEEITVFNEENQFDYIYAGDVARGLLEMAMSDASGVFNLGTGKPTSIKEIVATLQELFNNEIKVINENHSIYPEASYACMKKTEKQIGWLPQTTVRDGIQKIIQYEREKTC